MALKKQIPAFTFWLVWAVALVPLLLSTVAFINGWRPGEQMNQGQLYPPGMRLEQLGLPVQQSGRWQLILITDTPCDEYCAEWQALMPNLHAALGRNRERLQWQQLQQPELLTGQLQSGLLLIDPQGFMVSHYSLGLKPQGVLKDLKRLLRISKVG